MIVLGVDPGSSASGWARVDVRGGNGLPVTVTYVSSGNALSKPSSLSPLMDGADVVGCEKLEGVTYPAKGPGIVSALIASSYVAGLVSGIAAARGIRCIDMPAVQWRRIVIGKPNANDALVKDVVHRLVIGLPKRTNVHVRDALGVALGVAWALGGAARKQAV